MLSGDGASAYGEVRGQNVAHTRIVVRLHLSLV